MPAAHKVRWAQLRVGVFAIASMVILAVLIWLLASRKPLWQHYAPLYTYVRDSASLGAGAPVRLNGIPIGSVDRVELSGSADINRTVRIVLKVEQDHLKDIPVDSTAEVSSENVLSGKYVSINKGQQQQTVRPGAELPGVGTKELADLVKRGFDIFDSAQAIIARLDRIVGLVEAGKGNVGKLLVDEELYRRLVATVAEFQKVTETLSSGRGTVGRLLYDESLYNEARSALARIDQLMQDLQAGQGTAGKFLKDPALYDDTRASIATLRKILDDVNAGHGTVGKLLKDEGAYNQIQGVLTRIDKTLDIANSGQGTIGQLLSNPQLFDSMQGLSTELNNLVKDIRANPKKFLRFKFSIF